MSMNSSVVQIASDVRAGRSSAAEATRHALDAIDRANPQINACVQVFHEQATSQARLLDERLARREQVGPLAGVPVVLKDNICLAWGKTTCGSGMLKDYTSPFTATAAQRLIDAGAIVVGKANLDEFAMGSSTSRSIHGPTRNPWDHERTPGGSSGGSAAIVASGAVPIALGSDTGGSIRQPASMCNVVGYKPSYGRVSRYGLVAYASSLDQIGPLTMNVADAALVTSIMAGADSQDSTCVPERAPELLQDLEQAPQRLTIGVPRQARSEANHPSVAAMLESSIKVLRDLGAVVVDVDLPLTSHGIAAYYIIATAEASSNLARFDGVRYGHRAALKHGEELYALYARSRAEGFGPEVQRRIMLGTHVLSSGYYDAYYATAQKVRRLIRRDFDRVFAHTQAGPAGSGCHVVIMPSAPTPAWLIGAKADDPLSEYLEDVYTVGVNLAGLPAISIPAGFSSPGAFGTGALPVGLQMVAPAMQDALLLRVARMFEKTTNVAANRPRK